MNVGISERIGVFFEKGSKLKKERNSGFSLCHSFVEFFHNCTELGGLIFRKDRRKGMFENFPGNID